MVHAFAAASDECHRFHDVASRSVIADVIFQGRMTSLPMHINQSAISYMIDMDNNVGAIIQVSFSVERLMKGQLSASHITVLYHLNDTRKQCHQLGVSRDITEETTDTDTDEVDEQSIGGVDAVDGMKYIVFLNMTQMTFGTATNNSGPSFPTSSAKMVHWALGSPELYTTKVQRTVLALACQHCGMSNEIMSSFIDRHNFDGA